MAADFLRAMQREAITSTIVFPSRGSKANTISSTTPPVTSEGSNIRHKLQSLWKMLFSRNVPHYSAITPPSSQQQSPNAAAVQFFPTRWRQSRWVWALVYFLALCGFAYLCSARGPTPEAELELQNSESSLLGAERPTGAVESATQLWTLQGTGEIASRLNPTLSWRDETLKMDPQDSVTPERSRNNLEFLSVPAPQQSNFLETRPPMDRPAVFQHRSAECTSDDPCDFLLIADLDKASRVSSSPLIFKSYLLGGRIWKLKDSNSSKPEFAVAFEPKPLQLTGKHNEAGRGLELSELLLYKGKLLSFDDRTGIIYELLSNNGTIQLVPRHLLTEASGDSVKGMKSEWATEKDGVMWVGSFGKEFTDPLGKSILSEANFWTATVDTGLNIRYHNWKSHYNLLREIAGYPYPGYLLHEAVNWSSHLRQWVFVPRRASREPYDEIADESRGSNLILLAPDDFSTVSVHTLGPAGPLEDPRRGTSSFKFLPASNDTIAVAIKSTEDSQAGQQTTFISIFETLTGRVLMDDVQVPFAAKFEGLEFLSRLSYDNFFPPTKDTTVSNQERPENLT